MKAYVCAFLLDCPDCVVRLIRLPPGRAIDSVTTTWAPERYIRWSSHRKQVHAILLFFRNLNWPCDHSIHNYFALIDFNVAIIFTEFVCILSKMNIFYLTIISA